jgi:hypothetical protein
MPALSNASSNAGASFLMRHLRRFNQNVVQHQAVGNLLHVDDSTPIPGLRA